MLSPWCGSSGCPNLYSVADQRLAVTRHAGFVRAWAAVAYGALGAAVLTMVVLHLADRLDPLTSTVSDYAWRPDGALFTVSVLAVAVAAVAVPVALVGAGLPAPGRVVGLFGVGVVGLLASIVFPTNAFGTPASADAVLHRYASGLFFLSLPIAAFLVLRKLPGPPVRWLTILSVLCGLGFLLSHLAAVGDVLPRGLTERGLLAVDLGLLAALATHARRAAR